MKDNLEIIRAACIKANPSIMEQYSITEIHGETGKQTGDGRKQFLARAALGRPIRFADMLLLFTHISLPGIDISVGGSPKTPACLLTVKKKITNWNLLKDDLREQSEETITFLAGLLSENK